MHCCTLYRIHALAGSLPVGVSSSHPIWKQAELVYISNLKYAAEECAKVRLAFGRTSRPHSPGRYKARGVEPGLYETLQVYINVCGSLLGRKNISLLHISFEELYLCTSYVMHSCTSHVDCFKLLSIQYDITLLIEPISTILNYFLTHQQQGNAMVWPLLSFSLPKLCPLSCYCVERAGLVPRMMRSIRLINLHCWTPPPPPPLPLCVNVI